MPTPTLSARTFLYSFNLLTSLSSTPTQFRTWEISGSNNTLPPWMFDISLSAFDLAKQYYVPVVQLSSHPTTIIPDSLSAVRDCCIPATSGYHFSGVKTIHPYWSNPKEDTLFFTVSTATAKPIPFFFLNQFTYTDPYFKFTKKFPIKRPVWCRLLHPGRLIYKGKDPNNIKAKKITQRGWLDFEWYSTRWSGSSFINTITSTATTAITRESKRRTGTFYLTVDQDALDFFGHMGNLTHLSPKKTFTGSSQIKAGDVIKVNYKKRTNQAPYKFDFDFHFYSYAESYITHRYYFDWLDSQSWAVEVLNYKKPPYPKVVQKYTKFDNSPFSIYGRYAVPAVYQKISFDARNVFTGVLPMKSSTFYNSSYSINTRIADLSAANQSPKRAIKTLNLGSTSNFVNAKVTTAFASQSAVPLFKTNAYTLFTQNSALSSFQYNTLVNPLLSGTVIANGDAGLFARIGRDVYDPSFYETATLTYSGVNTFDSAVLLRQPFTIQGPIVNIQPPYNAFVADNVVNYTVATPVSALRQKIITTEISVPLSAYQIVVNNKPFFLLPSEKIILSTRNVPLFKTTTSYLSGFELRLSYNKVGPRTEQTLIGTKTPLLLPGGANPHNKKARTEDKEILFSPSYRARMRNLGY